jgi:hypothetical protein
MLYYQDMRGIPELRQAVAAMLQDSFMQVGDDSAAVMCMYGSSSAAPFNVEACGQAFANMLQDILQCVRVCVMRIRNYRLRGIHRPISAIRQGPAGALPAAIRHTGTNCHVRFEP